MRALRAAAVIGGLVVTLCAAALLSALSPSTSVTPLSLATGQDRLAASLMAQPTAGNLDGAAEASRAALEQTPYDTSALLRLAHIDWMRNGGLDAEGVQAFAESYRRVAVDRAVGFWRIRFALENWDRMPPDVRGAVRSEVLALASEPGHRWPLRKHLTGIQNRQGRVVASLWRYQVAQKAG